MDETLDSETRAAARSGDYLERVRALAPLIERSVEAIERERRLPPALVAAMMEADFFRMLLPRPFGGAEIDPMTFVRVIEAIAKIDGSTAWILCQTAVTAMTAARLAPEAAAEMWREPHAVLAWGPGTEARAVVVEGGFRVSGSFAFASGCWYATWLGGDCAVVAADGTPRLLANGKPETRRVLFPAACAVMRDIWHVIGLRGTGSDGYTVTDVFVPHAFTVARVDDPADRRYFGRLYDVSHYSMFACGFAALALGLARSLLDSFVALASEKTPRGYKNRLRDEGVTQAEIGFAEARLRAARMYLMGTLARRGRARSAGARLRSTIAWRSGSPPPMPSARPRRSPTPPSMPRAPPPSSPPTRSSAASATSTPSRSSSRAAKRISRRWASISSGWRWRTAGSSRSAAARAGRC